MKNTGLTNYTYNISPNNEWVLECITYRGIGYTDSAELFIFHNLDTLNKKHITTFITTSNDTLYDISIQNGMISGITRVVYAFSHETWSKNLDTVYLTIRWNYYKDIYSLAIDISSITSNGINENPNVSRPQKRIQALNSPNPFSNRTLIKYSIPEGLHFMCYQDRSSLALS